MDFEDLKRKAESSDRFRIGVLVVPLGVIFAAAYWFSMSQLEREAIQFKAAGLLGSALPAILIGAAAGWLKYSRRVWLWTTVCLLLGTYLILHYPVT